MFVYEWRKKINDLPWSALVLGDSAKRKTIRFDENVYCLLAFAGNHLAFASPYGFVNNGYANSVCCIYFLCAY